MSAFVCQENVGFLFSHACGGAAAMACMRCAKPVCDRHLTSMGMEMLCPACARTHASDTSGHGGSNEDHPSYYYDDYGYYGAASGGSHDANDFTEADGESLRREDEASFEEDMGGS